MKKILLDRSVYNLSDTPETRRFKKMIADAVLTYPKVPYGFSAADAALGWELFQIPGADLLACKLSMDFMAKENDLMATRGYPAMSYDSYLYAGGYIKDLALTIDWCSDALTPEWIEKAKAHMKQTVWNLAHYDQANWGGSPDVMNDGAKFQYNGWARNNALNNYFYAQLNAHIYEMLINDSDRTWLDSRLLILRDLWSKWNKGLPEGTGYSLSLASLFSIIKVLEESTGELFPEIEEEANNVIECWAHLSIRNHNTGKFDEIVPFMDHSRASRHMIYDGDRQLMLTARMMSKSEKHRAMVTWWLGEISHTRMTAFNYCSVDMLNNGTIKQAPDTNYLHMDSAGHFVWRDNWEKDCTVISYAAGPNIEAHDHDDQGSFQMYYHGPQTTTENIWSHSGILAGSQYHNCLRFDDAAGKVIAQSSKGICTLDVVDPNEVFMNLTPAYSLASGIQHTRRSIHGAGYIWTHDTFKNGTSADQVWQANVPHKPIIAGNIAKCGNLTIKVISPAHAILSIVDWSAVMPANNPCRGYKLEVRDSLERLDGEGEFIVEQIVDLTAATIPFEWETKTIPTPIPTDPKDPPPPVPPVVIAPIHTALPLWSDNVTHVMTTAAIHAGRSWHWSSTPTPITWIPKENVTLQHCVATSLDNQGLPSAERKWELLANLSAGKFVRLSTKTPLNLTVRDQDKAILLHEILTFPPTTIEEDPEMIEELKLQINDLIAEVQDLTKKVSDLEVINRDHERSLGDLNLLVEEQKDAIESLEEKSAELARIKEAISTIINSL